MGRTKLSVKPAEKSRNAAFVKRMKGLKKKIHELSVLCGIDACLIVLNGPTTINNNNNSNLPSTDRLTEPAVVWPDNREEVHRLIDKFQSSDKQRKQSANLFDQSEVSKLPRDNVADLSDSIDVLKEDELRVLLGSLDSEIRIVSGEIESMKCQDCIFEGEARMVEYSTGAPDHQDCFAAPVITQRLDYVTPPDYLHHCLDLPQLLDYDCPYDPSMIFDVDPAATGLMPMNNPSFSCDNLDSVSASTKNLNTGNLIYNYGYHQSNLHLPQISGYDCTFDPGMIFDLGPAATGLMPINNCGNSVSKSTENLNTWLAPNSDVAATSTVSAFIATVPSGVCSDLASESSTANCAAASPSSDVPSCVADSWRFF